MFVAGPPVVKRVGEDLTKEELDKQGWTSYITSYNTRNLLHYVRLLPDNRFLFGARGGINADKKSQIKNQQLSRTEFERMYPAWSHVQTEFYWNGLICFFFCNVIGMVITRLWNVINMTN